LNLDRQELRKLTKDQLIDIIFELAEKLEAQGKRIEALERAAARSAAPFSKGKGKREKGKPGRKRATGLFARRGEPQARLSDRVELIEVPLESNMCPECGAALEVETRVASTIDTPEEPRRVIKRFEVEAGECPYCGAKVRGEHPDLPADQFGACAHRVGENVLAQAFTLHYHSGMTLRKAADAIGILTGISITQGALTQRVKKLCENGGCFGRAYAGLRGEIRREPVVNTDDTGWRTGGQPSYLMGFFSPLLAVYQVRDRHRHQEVQEMLGQDFDGLLGTDRGASYEARAFDELRQQKCLCHLLVNLSKVEKAKRGRARCFTRDLKKTLRAALKLWQEHRAGRIGRAEYRRRGAKIEERLSYQLRDRILSDADNQRMLDGIGMQHDRGRVFLFLEHPEVEPTNNRAERGLRPAVIARKVSQCSRNATGAGIFETMKSITATLALRGQNISKTLADLMRGGSMPAGPNSR
jgi:hypothetical protein